MRVETLPPEGVTQPSRPASPVRRPRDDVSHDENEAGADRALFDMADKVRDIHAILAAGAKDFGVQVPQRARTILQPTRWVPKEDAYDMEKTIEYILGTLPPDDIVQRTAEYIKDQWSEPGEFHSIPHRIPKRVQYDESSEGWKDLFVWNVMRRPLESFGNTIEMLEYGYDSSGHLCELGHYGGLELYPFGDYVPDFSGLPHPEVIEHMVIHSPALTCLGCY